MESLLNDDKSLPLDIKQKERRTVYLYMVLQINQMVEDDSQVNDEIEESSFKTAQ